MSEIFGLPFAAEISAAPSAQRPTSASARKETAGPQPSASARKEPMAGRAFRFCSADPGERRRQWCATARSAPPEWSPRRGRQRGKHHRDPSAPPEWFSRPAAGQLGRRPDSSGSAAATPATPPERSRSSGGGGGGRVGWAVPSGRTHGLPRAGWTLGRPRPAVMVRWRGTARPFGRIDLDLLLLGMGRRAGVRRAEFAKECCRGVGDRC
jgi:hypothetical protein